MILEAYVLESAFGSVYLGCVRWYKKLLTFAKNTKSANYFIASTIIR